MNRNCTICDRPIENNNVKYCLDCKRILKRIKKKDERNQKECAVRNSWNGKNYTCYYTGITLNISDFSSPFYFTFDHTYPRDKKNKIVACASFINDMKSDSTEKEFINNIIILADHFRKTKKIKQEDFVLQYFKRKK